MTTTKQYIGALGRTVVYIVIVAACLGIWYALYRAAALFFGW